MVQQGVSSSPTSPSTTSTTTIALFSKDRRIWILPISQPATFLRMGHRRPWLPMIAFKPFLGAGEAVREGLVLEAEHVQADIRRIRHRRPGTGTAGHVEREAGRLGRQRSHGGRSEPERLAVEVGSDDGHAGGMPAEHLLECCFKSWIVRSHFADLLRELLVLTLVDSAYSAARRHACLLGVQKRLLMFVS
ncbi:hypothetical protein AHiyo8_11650 [Arthrobacter sp. Hiyo8]|nr:hypothetical protein AHiyo8_11650 [Arthrobacter sp. Hiyo8]